VTYDLPLEDVRTTFRLLKEITILPPGLKAPVWDFGTPGKECSVMVPDIEAAGTEMSEEYGDCVDKVSGAGSRPARAALLVAIVFAGSAISLRAASPKGDESVASTAVSEHTNQPVKPLAQRDIVPIAMHSSSPDASPAAPYRAVLDQYCVVCHNEQLHTADLVLSKMDVANVGEGAAEWEKVVDKLRTGAMPPAGVPRPDKATYDSFTAFLETSLDRAAAAHPQPGRVVIHRLNRSEYTSAIHDLLATDIDGASLLPVDDSGYGFDNIADVLSVSPMLLARYMSAAGKVTRLAIGDPTVVPALETYKIPPLLLQDSRTSEDLPFGSRGGIAVRHNFPVDGEYVIKIRLQRDGQRYDQQIIGLEEPHQLDVRVDGERIKLFTVGGEYPEKTKSGSSAKARANAGEINGDRLKDTPRDKYLYTADAALEVRFSAKAGPRLVGVNFLNDTEEPEGALQTPVAKYRYVDKSSEGRSDSTGNTEYLPAVAEVAIGGPFNSKGLGETPSRHKIFVCRPTGSADELSCAKKILSTLAHRAYRRPVTDEDLRPLLSVYEAGRKERDFEAGIALALRRMLVAPEFLFRIEHDPADVAPGTAYRISDLELASRLSFFLWSSIPDDELLDVAARGKLKDPAVLEQQVRRMIADSRSKALVDNFAGQWLYLRNMPGVQPDLEAFPEFDENLRAAFEQETELFLESNLREDRSIINLLNADYTFVNERLARFYGIPNVYGSQFRRVTFSGEERRGLLGQGSVLTVTSYANRTSPTIRGKWLLVNVLGTPPPPPPADVPSLKEDNTRNGKVLTMRERMEEHRANPACSGCHARMDPLGFALENFDGIGQWRNTSEAHTAIDASGVLPDGTKFNGPAELRKILLSNPEAFAATMTERLLTYALGRGAEYYDKPAIRKITREAASNDYRWSSLILGVVKSTPFQMRMVKPQESGPIKTTVSQNQPLGGSKP
jgi:mono/diheme cytochrome c family protein